MDPETARKDLEKKPVGIIFDPPITFRYLPSEVAEKNRVIDLNKYTLHRYRIANAKSKIDNKAPYFNLDQYYNPELLELRARNVKMQYKNNMSLVRGLNKINRFGGKVDCWNMTHKIKSAQDFLYEIKYQNKIIEFRNRELYQKMIKLREKPGPLSPQVMALSWKTIKEEIEYKSFYPWFKNISQYPPITENATMPTTEKNFRRIKCFFDLMLDYGNVDMGKIIFELYDDFVPSICQNFKAFCKGYRGLSYKGTHFHRIVTGYLCQGGDVTKFNGTGGACIFDGVVPPENFTLQHTCPGVLSTSLGENGSFDSKFILTFRPLRTMDGKKVVFGKIISGLDILCKIENYGTKFGEPLKKMVVSNCGVISSSKNRSKRASSLESKRQSARMSELNPKYLSK